VFFFLGGGFKCYSERRDYKILKSWVQMLL
jgi:hypothetical protein